jgi:hypothetical protein
MSEAVLLLMHQGNSFTEEMNEFLRRRGIALVALSSAPEKEEVFAKNQKHLADWIATEGHELTREDALAAVATFRDRGYTLLAAIATFEGYRLLMAELNHNLGARDSSNDALGLCLHKYHLRQFLRQERLSSVRCYRVDGGKAPELDPSVTWFVKPVRGAASFASFILKSIDDLCDLPRIQAAMRSDHRMSAIFMGQYDFLVEEYIEGPEFSFETIMIGDAHHVCVHEKARVERQERTTLEAMSITPPVSLDRETILAGARFVSQCLTTLGLSAGAFHVEAKYWTTRRRWEIIEINPRMGGSLINASVRTVTESSLLELWLETLLVKSDDTELRARLGRVSQIEALRCGQVSRAAVFLSKYGEKGRTVESIEFSPPSRKPDIVKIHVEKGTALENSDRAICLMDALWQVEYPNLREEVEFLDRLANENFHVRYRPVDAPATASP